jgi:hypothetical protein
MAFCTIVEWDVDFDFARLTDSAGADEELPGGCLSRLVGRLETGACVIEVWQTGEDAKRFSEESAPKVSASEMPPPSRVVGFEAAVFQTR